ncbi:MAG: hypothetical protein L0Y60_03125, partial [Beijerinckiaceae bacterium]|nr:hypothetical protein [Beijerinckiaceae bacterium]
LAPPLDEAGRSVAHIRWERVKERARFCLQAVLPEGEAAEIVMRLNELPAPQPRIDEDLRNLLPADARHAWQIAANPVRRSLYFAGQEISLLSRELRRLAGGDWRGRIAAIYLSADAAASVTFRQNIGFALRDLQASSRGQLVQDLTGGLFEARAHVNVAIQDDEGLVRLAYSSHADMFTNRSAVASTAKIGAAIALGRVDRPDALYCAKKPPQGRSCAPEAPRLPARVAFARSDNASILYALESRPATRRAAAEVADILGLNAPGVPPVSALTLGLAELASAELLRALRATGLGYCGQAASAGEPRFVNAVKFLDPETGDGVVVASKEHNEIGSGAISRLFDGERGRRFFAAVLEAMVEPGGSLAALGDLAEAKTARLFAKTGTHSVSGATRALTVAGILLREGKPWTFIVTVAPAHHGESIGRELTASHLAPVVRILLSAARPAPLRLDGTNEAGKRFRAVPGTARLREPPPAARSG